MNTKGVIEHIVSWLNEYAEKSRSQGFVVGVSGGIDSAVTSALCCLTGRPTLLIEMPIHQAKSQVDRAQEHIRMMREKHSKVSDLVVNLTPVYTSMVEALMENETNAIVEIARANMRARLRMCTLYYHAATNNSLVAGTGNKVEDFGIGFYTKWGDGAADLNPIADLNKTEVYALGRELGIVESIINAAPTDGLFGDNRSDEDQIGASYPELEWAMEMIAKIGFNGTLTELKNRMDSAVLSDRQKLVAEIFYDRHLKNQHKMKPIPVCEIPLLLRNKE
ncbi:MAG: NAD(+) synthase [Flavobacteriales bacterium]|nr:NAD(+) synthase [Flavobacteriales bacterium]